MNPVLANLGPVVRPEFILGLWFLCVGIEARVVQLLLVRRGVASRPALEVAVLVNTASWPLFIALFAFLSDQGLDLGTALAIGEILVVLGEAWAIAALIRRRLPEEERPTGPHFRDVLVPSLIANAISLGIGYAVMWIAD